MAKHLQSSAHQSQLQACEQQAQMRKEAEERYQYTYHGLTVPANQAFVSKPSAPRPSLFQDFPDSDETQIPPQTGYPSSYSWDKTIPTLHSHPVDLSSADQQDFLERQFHAILAHAQNLDQFGEEDDTEYLADDLRALGKYLLRALHSVLPNFVHRS